MRFVRYFIAKNVQDFDTNLYSDVYERLVCLNWLSQSNKLKLHLCLFLLQSNHYSKGEF
jgi:hypothetical protein